MVAGRGWNTKMQNTILAIDTATHACSAALQIGTKIIAIENLELSAKKNSELILEMVQQLLNKANLSLKDLDAIAFGKGPGSFTGIRLAASIAQGLCFGANLPASGISTLQAIAQRAHREFKINNALVAYDAHMQELYWAAYITDTNGIMQPLIPDMLCKPDNLFLPGSLDNYQWHGIGNAWEVYQLKKQCSEKKVNLLTIKPDSYSSAHDIAMLAALQYQQGAMVKAAEITPIYLQNNLYEKQN